MRSRNQDCICESVFKGAVEEEIRSKYIQEIGRAHV